MNTRPVFGSGFVPIYDIAPASRVTVGDIVYVYQDRGREGHRVRRSDDLGICEIFTHEHMHHLIKTEAIHIDEGFFTSVKAEVRLRNGPKSFSDLTEAQATKVLVKKRYCDRFLAMQAVDRRLRRTEIKMGPAIAAITREIDDEARQRKVGRKPRAGKGMRERLEAPSASQLRRWLVDYCKCGYHPDGLIDLYAGPGTLRRVLTADEYEIHLAFANRYASRTKPTKALCFGELQSALDVKDAALAVNGLPPMRRLKRRAFEAMIDRLDPFYVCVGREGRDAALRLWGITTTGFDVERPFERLEIDEWRVDLAQLMIAADVWRLLDKDQRAAVARSRAWLSAAIDARTGMVPALRLLDSAPNIQSALATIELAMIDKSAIAEHCAASQTYVHGKPESIAMDNGTNLTADAVLARLVRLGIKPIHPPAGLAQMRGRVERLFFTLRTKIAAMFSGQTFANILIRGDYDSRANAVLDFDEINRVFIRGVLDIYHHSPRDGYEQETPWDCWRRLSGEFGVPPPPHRDVMRHVLGIECKRKIGDAGIRFLGIRYQSKAVQVLRRKVRQQPVDIRVNRFDLSSISVRTSDGWITVFAQHDGLQGVSYWRWRQAVLEIRTRNAQAASLSRHVVSNAVRDLGIIAEEAIARAEIRSPVLSADEFDKAELTLFRSLDFADDGSFGVDDEESAWRPEEAEPAALPKPARGKPDSTAMTIPGQAASTFDDLDDDDGFGSDDKWSSN